MVSKNDENFIAFCVEKTKQAKRCDVGILS